MDIVTDSLYAFLTAFAKEEGNKRFLFTDSRTYTAAGALYEVKALARQLSREGVFAGDYVALRAVRSVDTALLFLALQVLGAAAVLTDPHEKAAESLKDFDFSVPVKGWLTNEEADGGIAAEGNWKFVRQSGNVRKQKGRDHVQKSENSSVETASKRRKSDSPGKEGQGTKIEFSMPKRDNREYFPPADIFAPAAVIFTSGSTGRGKAVVLTQFNLCNHAANYGWGGCYRETDVSAQMLPFHHVFGLAVLLTALYYRYEVYFPKKISPESILEAAERFGLTRLDGVPSLLASVSELAAEKKVRIPSLRISVIGGAPIPEERFSFIEETLGITLVPVYGMSECIGISGLPEDASETDRRMTAGYFLPMNEGCIMNEKMQQLAFGEEGEICVRSPVIMKEYLGNPAETENAVDEEGWLHTGDLGFLDERELLHITGRKKDIIIRNGNNLSPGRIEEKILRLPGVEDVLVTGIPDRKAGEVPGAIIVLRSGEDQRNLQLSEVLSRIEMPGKVLFAGQIPLTASGKPDKQAAKKMFC